ncbi:hypothetical protein K501DRAFT_92487 [Backusella circina FSU 941]|nr:hypothetical protein K501DRAFT_92487 [Backusella circina FSU 941]
MMKDFNEAQPFYTDKLQKELIWEELFNLDVLQKKRFRHSAKNYNAKYELDYGIQTDGHMVSILFTKKVYERIPNNRQDLKLLATEVDLSDWKRGLYKLNKQPTGLSCTDRIVGIDPGYRDLIHAVTSNDGMDNKTTRKMSSFSVSNGEYQ